MSRFQASQPGAGMVWGGALGVKPHLAGVVFSRPSRAGRWLVQVPGSECMHTHVYTYIPLPAGREPKVTEVNWHKWKPGLLIFYVIPCMLPPIFLKNSYTFFSPLHFKDISSLAIQKGSRIWSVGNLFLYGI